jgi:hypothetical protein
MNRPTDKGILKSFSKLNIVHCDKIKIVKTKVHAMEVHGGRGDIAPTHT